ncbi:hypothetical protein QLS71_002605 [Mariniflexile litorale]|uniref:SPOR domain-containing protein n=1 Tax=Mariniflexile litorale TaxID=3045158 RepID=A0AAU7EH16_9FLAO|nr:hypothetical protein [Mariniflexile sp. KMM 9835]MDQ8209909.1 hypothetical protein [Mariniflexile sp. KMM 9835]
MKTKMLLIPFMLMTSIKCFSQSLISKRVDNYSFNIIFGANLIDNSNNGPMPFDSADLDFNTPFFITAERSITSNWSTSITLSTNKLNLNEGLKNYYSADIFANLYLDKLLFDNENFNVLLGFGTGAHIIGNVTKTSLNLTGGFRYWISPRLGVSTNIVGKLNSNNDEGLGNHYQFNTGLIWRIRGINPISKKTSSVFEKNTISKLESIEHLLKSESENKEVKINVAENQQSFNRILDSVKISIEASKKEVIDRIDELERFQKKVDSINRKVVKQNKVNILGNPEDSSKIIQGYYVIVHVLYDKHNVDKLKENLKKHNIDIEVFQNLRTKRYYISVAYFKTKAEAYKYRDSELDKSMFKDSWVHEQK